MSKKLKNNGIGRLFLLMGCPRAGKSFIARSWQSYEIDIHYNSLRKHVGNKKIPRIVVCSDWIRLALHGQPYVQESEDFVHSIKTLLIRTYLINGYDVLVDGTHSTKNSIEQILRIDPKADFYLVDTPVEECKKRAILSNQSYLIERGVIDRIAGQLELIKKNPVEFVDNLRKI